MTLNGFLCRELLFVVFVLFINIFFIIQLTFELLHHSSSFWSGYHPSSTCIRLSVSPTAPPDSFTLVLFCLCAWSIGMLEKVFHDFRNDPAFSEAICATSETLLHPVDRLFPERQRAAIYAKLLRLPGGRVWFS